MDQNDLYYIPGSWNVICDSCGKKIKASEAKQRWDGLIVCPDDFEMRQPQDFVKARADKISVPFTRPRPTDEFVFSCDLFTSSGVADVGVADCAQADNSQWWNQFYDELNNNYQDWQKQWCDPTTRTAIAGVGYAGCMTAGYNLQGYL
jgi:hypothetical protein